MMVYQTPFANGERIILEYFNTSHVDSFYIRWLNDPEINRYTSRGIYPLTKEDGESYAREAQSDKRIVLAIVLKKDYVQSDWGDITRYIGNISLQQIDRNNRSAELAILLGEKHGKGYGYEAAKLICKHGFDQLGLNRIYCGMHEENIGMQKLALKLGMVEEGRSRKALFKNGKFADIIHYGILKEEFYAHCGIDQSQSLPDNA